METSPNKEIILELFKGLSRREENVLKMYFGLDEQPVTDPWGRQLRPWTRNGEGDLLHWDNATRGTYYRMTTIEGKAVSLWMYPSPKHPLYK